MANPTCRTCDRSADAGAYCSSCAAGIMATALNPHSRGRSKKLPPRSRALPRDQSLRPATYPVNSACSGSPVLSLHGVTIIRKIAACWACGRTFWVCRLRERNFCSGKCRVRHHRAGFRKPGPLNLGQNIRWHGVGQSPMSALESISRSAPGSIFKSPLERAWYRVCLPVSM